MFVAAMFILREASTCGLKHTIAFHSKKLLNSISDPKNSPWQFRFNDKALSGLFKKLGFKLSVTHSDAKMNGWVRVAHQQGLGTASQVIV